ncbi:MAG: sigma factor-like helix-turn-helix DNA-binding protein [Planctomycetota bacterium]
MLDVPDIVAVREAMGRLSPGRQRIWRMLAHGYTQAEIAEELGCGVTTVNRHIKAVRRLLCDMGFEDWARSHTRWHRRQRRHE